MLVLALLPRLHERPALRGDAIPDPMGSGRAGERAAAPRQMQEMRSFRWRPAMARLEGYRDRHGPLADAS
jgi:hypothetical protein